VKPYEELYDLENDPDEVQNLADSSEYEPIKQRLWAALGNHLTEIRDVGFLPEGERFTRFGSNSPFDVSGDDAIFPFDRIFQMACRASNVEEALSPLLAGFTDEDGAVRYWAAMGLLMRGKSAVSESVTELRAALAD
jgi:uncharacterized sulfatase